MVFVVNKIVLTKNVDFVSKGYLERTIQIECNPVKVKTTLSNRVPTLTYLTII